MNLPEDVRTCLDTLENAGYPTYAVGGCVRDAVLGLTPHDYDLCTAALPEQMKQLFAHRELVLAGEKHGTIGVVTPDGVVEITTFRTEGGYEDSRHPGWVRFVDDIEGDLARRDFTVNAMAYSPTRGFADPFGGRADLQSRILRAVGDPESRFREDALRILRGVRFSVRFGLTPDPATENAMISLVPLMDNLARERVFEELCGILPLLQFDDLLHFAPILGGAIPELVPTVSFNQRSPHHAYDLYTHTAHVTARVSPDLSLRWAALLHDIGKVPTFAQDETGRGHFYGHAKESARMADAILHRLKAPTVLRERVVLLIAQHMTPLEPDRKLLRRRLSQYGAEAVWQLLQLQRADFESKGVGEQTDRFDHIAHLLTQLLEEDTCLTVRDLAIDGRDLMALGIPAGPQIGKILNTLLDQVLDETLPNEHNALLAAIPTQFN